MKTKQKLIVFIICTAFLLSFQLLYGQNCNCDSELEGFPRDHCTVVIVGKKASTDGSVISTHTCDCGVCDWTWRYVHPADHEEGATRKIYHFNQFTTRPPAEGLRWDVLHDNYTGLEIPQAKHTYGYLHGMFGYINDNQVAIGESTIGCRSEMNNNTPTPKIDITMMTLIAMERAKTARDAIKIMGELAVKYGYGYVDSGEMLAVSDPNEAWIFEVMPVGPLWTPDSGQPGAIWCAQRVPDDHVSVCPNESRIGKIDLENPDYFMASDNVISYAVEHGYYDPDSGEPFSWKKAYSPTEGSAVSTYGARGRMWRFFDLVAPSQNFSPDRPNMDFPFSIKPDEKVSLARVFSILRDKYEGTQFYTAKGLQGGPFKNPNHLPYGFTLHGERYTTPRMIGVNRAEYIAVTQCRDWLPDPIGGIVWIGLGAMDTDCFMPFYIGVKRIPKSFEIGDHYEFNRESARWAFDYVDFHTQVLYSYAIQDVRKAQEKWEKGAIDRTAEIDEKAWKLYIEAPDMAKDYLTEYCNNNANLVVDAWWKLGNDLLVKYNHLWIYDAKNRNRGRPEYPEWWLEELVKYNKMKPAGQDH